MKLCSKTFSVAMSMGFHGVGRRWACEQRGVLGQAVEPKEAASVSSAEVALCSGSELAMLGLAAAFSDPASFSLLVSLSAAAVIGAAALYSSWVFCFGGERALQGALGPA